LTRGEELDLPKFGVQERDKNMPLNSDLVERINVDDILSPDSENTDYKGTGDKKNMPQLPPKHPKSSFTGLVLP